MRFLGETVPLTVSSIHSETTIETDGVVFRYADNGFSFDALFVKGWSNTNWHDEHVTYGDTGATYWLNKVVALDMFIQDKIVIDVPVVLIVAF